MLEPMPEPEPEPKLGLGMLGMLWMLGLGQH